LITPPFKSSPLFCFELYGQTQQRRGGWFRYGKLLPYNEKKQVIEYYLLKQLRVHARENYFSKFAIGLNSGLYNDKKQIIKTKGLLFLDWDSITPKQFLEDERILKKIIGEKSFNNLLIVKRKIEGKISIHAILFEILTFKKIRKILIKMKHVDKEFKNLYYKNKNATIRITQMKYGKNLKYELLKEAFDLNPIMQGLYDTIIAFLNNESELEDWDEEEMIEIEKNIFKNPEPKIDYTTLTKYELKNVIN